MKFDATITLGGVLQIVTMIVMCISIIATVKSRLDGMKQTLDTHAEALKEHDATLAGYESRLFEVVSGLQRLVGRFETFEAFERRRAPRNN